MSLNTSDTIFLMAITFFGLGLLSFIAGIIVLLSRTMSKDIRTLATQTNRLAQKGILDGVAGLVGNASSLLDATNQLVRTATGIGVFLIIISFFFFTASVIILIKTL